MALGILMITFITITVISGLSIAFLFLAKGPKVKEVLFYVVSLLGMLIAFLNASSLPMNQVAGQIISWGIGFLSIIAICVHVVGKSVNAKFNSQVPASVGVALGIVKLFLF